MKEVRELLLINLGIHPIGTMVDHLELVLLIKEETQAMVVQAMVGILLILLEAMVTHMVPLEVMVVPLEVMVVLLEAMVVPLMGMVVLQFLQFLHRVDKVVVLLVVGITTI
jgi:hypothetical protein